MGRIRDIWKIQPPYLVTLVMDLISFKLVGWHNLIGELLTNVGLWRLT